MNAAARFITIEGADGVGKSTFCAGLAMALREQKIATIETREPGGGSELAARIRALILDPALPANALTQALLVYAARADHLERLIRPSLAQGVWVMCDRFHDSSYAYQSVAQGLPQTVLRALDMMVVEPTIPDCTFLLELEPEASQERRQVRKIAGDRFEQRPESFQSAVRSGFRQRAVQYPDRFICLDAAHAPASLITKAMAELRLKFPQSFGPEP